MHDAFREPAAAVGGRRLETLVSFRRSQVRTSASHTVIHVVAEIHLAPGARERFLEEFRRLTPLVRAEDGCIEYVGTVEVRTAIAAQAAPRDDVLTVVEKWRDEPALAAHLAAPHMDDHRARSRGLTTRVVVRVLREI